MMVGDLIELLQCLWMINGRPCSSCPYNPIPGRQWVYGCKVGQRRMVEEAIEYLKTIESDHTTEKTTDDEEGEWR